MFINTNTNYMHDEQCALEMEVASNSISTKKHPEGKLGKRVCIRNGTN